MCGFGKACNAAHKYLETGVCTVSANVVDVVGGVVVVPSRWMLCGINSTTKRDRLPFGELRSSQRTGQTEWSPTSKTETAADRKREGARGCRVEDKRVS